MAVKYTEERKRIVLGCSTKLCVYVILRLQNISVQWLNDKALYAYVVLAIV